MFLNADTIFLFKLITMVSNIYYICCNKSKMAKIDDVIKTKFQNDKHRFMANMVYTSNWFRSLTADFLKPYGISSQQFNILRILRGAKEEWVAMNDIKSLMVEKSPNATRLADKLLKAELVNRQRSSSDRRVVFLSISNKGLELLTNIDEDDMAYLDVMNNITDEEAKLVSDIFDRLRKD